MSQREIAAALGVSDTTVVRDQAASNEAPEVDNPSSESRIASNEAPAIDAEGMSQREIAATLGVDKQTVNRDLAAVSNETAEPETPSSKPLEVSNETPDGDGLADELITAEPDEIPKTLTTRNPGFLDSECALSSENAFYAHNHAH